MAFVRPVMRSALDHSADPVRAIEILNQILVAERRTGLFVTMLAGVLTLETGRFTFASAGHELPLHVRVDGSLAPAPTATGRLVGMFERTGVEARDLDIGLGEQLILYTDGITDAAAPGGERFGDARLQSAIGARPGDASATCSHIIDSVLRFQAEADPADDLALLVLRRLPA